MDLRKRWTADEGEEALVRGIEDVVRVQDLVERAIEA